MKSIKIFGKNHWYEYASEVKDDITTLEQLTEDVKRPFTVTYFGLLEARFANCKYWGGNLLNFLFNTYKDKYNATCIMDLLPSIAIEDVELTKQLNDRYCDIFVREFTFTDEVQTFILNEIEECKQQANDLYKEWSAEKERRSAEIEKRWEKWSHVRTIDYQKPRGGEDGDDGYLDAIYRNNETGEELRMISRDVFDAGKFAYPKRLNGVKENHLCTQSEKELLRWLHEFGWTCGMRIDDNIRMDDDDDTTDQSVPEIEKEEPEGVKVITKWIEARKEHIIHSIWDKLSNLLSDYAISKQLLRAWNLLRTDQNRELEIKVMDSDLCLNKYLFSLNDDLDVYLCFEPRKGPGMRILFVTENALELVMEYIPQEFDANTVPAYLAREIERMGSVGDTSGIKIETPNTEIATPKSEGVKVITKWIEARKEHIIHSIWGEIWGLLCDYRNNEELLRAWNLVRTKRNQEVEDKVTKSIQNLNEYCHLIKEKLDICLCCELTKGLNKNPDFNDGCGMKVFIMGEYGEELVVEYIPKEFDAKTAPSYLIFEAECYD